MAQVQRRPKNSVILASKIYKKPAWWRR